MDSFDSFIASYPSETFEKGQTILLKDAIPRAVYVIESGLVKSYTISATGEQRIRLIESKGEDIPIGFALGLLEAAPCFFEAYTRCVLRYVPREDYMLRLYTNPASLQHQYMRLSILLLSTLSRIDALEQAHAGDKVAATLLYMADHIGVRLRPYKSQLKIEITQQEIANALGLTRETTNIELKKLELKKILTHSRRSYILHMERLRQYVDEIDD